jgi:hypothetical protein
MNSEKRLHPALLTTYRPLPPVAQMTLEDVRGLFAGNLSAAVHEIARQVQHQQSEKAS